MFKLLKSTRAFLQSLTCFFFEENLVEKSWSEEATERRQSVLQMAIQKAGKMEVLTCFLKASTLCLPDPFQALVPEPSHNAVGCASLQCHSCAGGMQTDIQPFNAAGTWLINMMEDWEYPNPSSRTKSQLKDFSLMFLPHGEGKQPHAVILNNLIKGHISKYPIRLHGKKQRICRNLADQ